MITDAELIREYRLNPVRFVREVFGVEPDAWQKDALMAFADRDPNKWRISMQASVGVGKSAVLSWLVWNALLCYAEKYDHPKGYALSMTWGNLKDNFWPEIAKWQSRSEYLKEKFTWTKERVYCNDHPSDWFISARGFSKTADKEEMGRVLSGLHAKYNFFFIDEAGSIPPEVGKAAEQALSECKLGKVVMTGNPTSRNSLLYTASKDPSFHVIRITSDPEDPKRSPRIPKKFAQKQIDTYGRNDPWVQSMILGMFPESNIETLLSDFDVERAIGRSYSPAEIEYSEKILGVDCARFGGDSNIIFPRQGLMAFNFVELRQADGPTLGGRVIGATDKWGGVNRINVDGTGGYGASCIDFLRMNGVRGVNEINFAAQASQPDRFYNKRSEMYWHMAEWVKRRGALIDDAQLTEELCDIHYSFKSGKLLIEPKESIKKRLGRSPDKTDGLALTFAMPDKVLSSHRVKLINESSRGGMRSDAEYNPFP